MSHTAALAAVSVCCSESASLEVIASQKQLASRDEQVDCAHRAVELLEGVSLPMTTGNYELSVRCRKCQQSNREVQESVSAAIRGTTGCRAGSVHLPD